MPRIIGYETEVKNECPLPKPHYSDAIREKLSTTTVYSLTKYFVRDNSTGQVNRVDSYRDFHYGKFEELMRFSHIASPTELRILEAEKRSAEKRKRLADKTREALK